MQKVKQLFSSSGYSRTISLVLLLMAVVAVPVVIFFTFSEKGGSKRTTASAGATPARPPTRHMYIGTNPNTGTDWTADQQIAAMCTDGIIWVNKAPVPTKIFRAEAAIVNNKLYIVGGNNSSFQESNIVSEYNPDTNTWTRKADMPIPMSGHQAIALNNKIYAIGGVSKSTLVEEYDPDTNRWTRKADMNNGRSYFGIASYAGKIYVFGGTYNARSASVEEYDPNTNTWTRKADMPMSRSNFNAATVNDKIYIISGFTSLNAYSPDVYEYNPSADSWTRKADMPMGSQFMDVIAVNNNIYAIVTNNTSGFSFTKKLYRYNTTTNSWTTLPDVLTQNYPYILTAGEGNIIYLLPDDEGEALQVGTISNGRTPCAPDFTTYISQGFDGGYPNGAQIVSIGNKFWMRGPVKDQNGTRTYFAKGDNTAPVDVTDPANVGPGASWSDQPDIQAMCNAAQQAGVAGRSADCHPDILLQIPAGWDGFTEATQIISMGHLFWHRGQAHCPNNCGTRTYYATGTNTAPVDVSNVANIGPGMRWWDVEDVRAKCVRYNQDNKNQTDKSSSPEKCSPDLLSIAPAGWDGFADPTLITGINNNVWVNGPVKNGERTYYIGADTDNSRPNGGAHWMDVADQIGQMCSVVNPAADGNSCSPKFMDFYPAGWDGNDANGNPRFPTNSNLVAMKDGNNAKLWVRGPVFTATYQTFSDANLTTAVSPTTATPVYFKITVDRVAVLPAALADPNQYFNYLKLLINGLVQPVGIVEVNAATGVFKTTQPITLTVDGTYTAQFVSRCDTNNTTPGFSDCTNPYIANFTATTINVSAGPTNTPVPPSATPIRPTVTPVPPTASCTSYPAVVNVGQQVTWRASNQNGGNGSYIYSWIGTETNVARSTGATSEFTISYSTPGNKLMFMQISSGGVASGQIQCASATVTPLTTCTPSYNCGSCTHTNPLSCSLIGTKICTTTNADCTTSQNTQSCNTAPTTCPAGYSCTSGTCIAPTNTPVPTATPTRTPTPTNTPVPTLTNTPIPTATPIPPTIPPQCQRNSGGYNASCLGNQADYAFWKKEFIKTLSGQSPDINADYNGDGAVNLKDFNLWRDRTYRLGQ